MKSCSIISPGHLIGSLSMSIYIRMEWTLEGAHGYRYGCPGFRSQTSLLFLLFPTSKLHYRHYYYKTRLHILVPYQLTLKCVIWASIIELSFKSLIINMNRWFRGRCDSRLGCEMSWVQIPGEPNQFYSPSHYHACPCIGPAS